MGSKNNGSIPKSIPKQAKYIFNLKSKISKIFRSSIRFNRKVHNSKRRLKKNTPRLYPGQ